MDVLRDQLNHQRWRGRGLRLSAAALLAFSIGCNDTPGGDARRAVSPPPAGEGGSPFSIDSALTLFQRDIPPLDTLQHAEASIDAIVARFARSLEQSDTATLRNIVMSRREYAYLWYPTSHFTRAPTKQEPGLAWFLHIQHSEKGATRLLNRYGGKPLRIARNECKPPARIEGRNTMWYDCMQRLVEGGDTVVTRLFGGVYERDGRFKIFSYSNDL